MQPRTRSFISGWTTHLGTAAALVFATACAEGTAPGGSGNQPDASGRLGGGIPTVDAGGGGGGGGEERPDASPFRPDADLSFGDDAEPPPDAGAGFERVTITYNDSTDLLENRFAGCVVFDDDNVVTAHAGNKYFRVFDLSDFGINSDFFVETVHIGASRVEGDDGSQPVSLRFAHQSDPDVPDPDNATTMLQGTLEVSDRELAFVNPIVNEIVPAGESFYVEMELPDGRPDGNVFLIGVNQENEGAPGFIESDDCSIERQRFDDVEAFEGNRWVVAVTGVHQP